MPRSGFWVVCVCESGDLSLPQYQLQYCTLCCLSTEFLGSLKQGLYFCCKVSAFAIFLEAMLKLFSDYFH